jgi:hypothetical protein
MYLKSKRDLEIFLKTKPYHLNYIIPKFYENNQENITKTIIDENNIDKEKLKFYKLLINNYIYEKTPEGHVFMNWDQNENGFHYWSNNTISYKILEVVARKYVLTFNCVDLYIDKIFEVQQKYNKLKKEIAENIKKEIQIQNASKQKLNTNSNPDSKTNINDIFLTSKTKKYLKTEIVKEDLVCEKANKYIKKGKINELNFTIKKNAKIKNISFKDWTIMKLSIGC